MRIIPKNLPLSSGAPDMLEYPKDLSELSQICESSLMGRSKPTLARTWLKRWKTNSWMLLLSGRILKPSLAKSFVTRWTASLRDTHASHSLLQGSDKEKMTPDTFGRTYAPLLELCTLDTASLKMSKVIYRLDSPQLSAIWKKMVIKQRGEYSARLKSAHRTAGKEYLSWATATARDWKGCGNAIQRKDGKGRMDTIEAVVKFGQPAQEKSSTSGNRQELSENWHTPDCSDRRSAKSKQQGLSNQIKNWATPNTMDHLALRSEGALLKQATGVRDGRTRPGNLREQVDPHSCEVYQAVKNKNWPTPHANCVIGAGRQGREGGDNLQTKVASWPTPNCPTGDPKADGSAPQGMNGGLGHREMMKGQFEPGAKLNPNWVCTLMGVPVGWVTAGEGNRIDELRLLGNGVVPQTVTKAWLVLSKRFNQ